MQAAIYIEQRIKKTGETIGWAGYIYASGEVDPAEYVAVKEATDQWGATVQVYRSKDVQYFEHPGGVSKSNLVVLFEESDICPGCGYHITRCKCPIA